jgi:uncharacterized protein (TIRG00374 family)
LKSLLKRLFLSLAIGAAMLYLATRGDSFSGLSQAFGRADWSVLLPYFAYMAIQHFFRSWRWGQLLAPIHPVPFSRLLPVSSVGFFAILALPLRMGEIVRPYLIADPPALRVSHGLGTMAVERVFDGLVLSLCGFAAVAIAREQGSDVPSWVFAAGVVALGLFVAALSVLVVTLWQRERAVALCRRLVAIVSQRLAARAASIAEGVVEGFRALPNIKRLALFTAATLCYWLFNALSFEVLASGFDIDLTLGQSIALVALIGIGIMVPAGPGFVGNFELFAKGALGLYLDRQTLHGRGMAFIVAAHATNATWYIATGAIAMFSAHVSFNRVISVSTHAADSVERSGAGAAEDS